MPELETPPVKEGSPASRFSALLNEAGKQDLAKQGVKPEEAKTTAPVVATTPETPKAPDKPVEAKPEAKAGAAKKEYDADYLDLDNPKYKDLSDGKVNPKSKDFFNIKGAASHYKTEAETAKAKATEYEAKLKELEKRPKANADEIEAMKKRLTEAETFRDTVALEWSPQFQEKYGTRTNSALSKLNGVVDPATAEKLKPLLTMADSTYKTKALDEILENLTPTQAGRILNVDAEMAGVMAERNGELARSQESLTKIQQEHASRLKERAENLGKAFNEKLTAMADNPLFKKREGEGKEVAEWNSALEENLELSKMMFSGELPPEDMADMSMRAARFHVIAGENARLNKEVTELRAMLAKIGGAGPGVEAGKGGGVSPDAPRKGGLAAMIGQRVDRETGR